ncbi:MAG: hypothetical protein ABI837_16815 [Acidobacteriota bacterium]
MTPEFPIRIISDDGEVTEIESPDDLLEQIDAIDSASPSVWIRDAFDRNVHLRMRYGTIEVLEVEEAR